MKLELKYGLISDVKPGFARVNFTADGFVSGWLPVLVRKSKTDKENWQLEVDEHVVCLMGEDCDEGVIIGAIHSKADPPDSGESSGKFRMLFSDGTLIEYDKGDHRLTADVKGDALIKSSGTLEAEAGSKLVAKAAVSAEIEAPAIKCKASVSVEVESLLITLKGNTIVNGTLVVSGALTAASISTSGGGSIVSAGDMTVTGVISGGTVKAGAIDLASHKHPGVQTGSGMTGPATP